LNGNGLHIQKVLFKKKFKMLNLFNTSIEIAESDIDTALLPLGSVEPKGPPRSSKEGNR